MEKFKQINHIMKQIVRVEQEANSQMYRRFNQQEKLLLSELREKEREREAGEKEQKVSNVRVSQ